MAREETDLSTFTMASDYDPAHYNWPEKELAALGDCKAVAEVIKKRLEDNGAKIKEMYVIEHTGTDETRTHYHILVKFEDKQGATLKEIAKYIGVRPEIIEKPKPGGHSYDNMLAYLIHIKYKNKKQYAPEDVVTLAGTDYKDHYSKHKESWEKARAYVSKKGGKPLARLFREAINKLESGELFYKDLAGIPEYRRLLFEPKYMRQLKKRDECVREVAQQDYERLQSKIQNGEITTLNEITASDEWKLAYVYKQGDIENALRGQKYNTICAKIKNKEITSLEEIAANEDWKSVYEHYLHQIESALGMLR